MNMKLSRHEKMVLRHIVEHPGEEYTPADAAELFPDVAEPYQKAKGLLYRLAMKLSAMNAPIRLEDDWKPGKGGRKRYIITGDRDAALDFINALEE